MAEPNEPKNHHYVPEGYLVGFTRQEGEQNYGDDQTKEGQLWQHRRTPNGTLHPRPLHPAATGYEKKLYTAPRVVPWATTGVSPKHRDFKKADFLDDGEPDPWIEQLVFGPIDDKAAKALAYFRTCDPADGPGGHAQATVMFLNSLIERHPRDLARRDLDVATSLDKALNLDEVARVEERLGLARSKPLDVPGMARQFVRAIMVRNVVDKNAKKALSELSYSLLPPPVGHAFITSDDPLVVNCGLPLDEHGVFSLSLAISPWRLLIGVDEQIVRDDYLDKLAGSHNHLLLQKRPLFLYSRWRIQDHLHAGIVPYLSEPKKT